MATYYPGLSNQRDVLPAPYLRDEKLSPGPEPAYLPVDMMYLNQASSGSYAELLSGVSLSSHDRAQVSSVGTREELEFIPPTGDHVTGGVSVDNTVNKDPQMVSRASIHIVDSEQSLMCQGLSLSLGTQIPSSGHTPLFHYQYTEPTTSSLLSSHFQAEYGSQSKESCNAEYYNLTEGMHNTVKLGPLNNPYSVVGPDEMHYSPHLYEPSGLVSTIYNSKYLKAAQQLLDEVVNVQKALKHSVKHKHSNSNKSDIYGSKEIDMKMNGNSPDAHESTAKCSLELSPSERQDLQNKLTKLSSMLDEVDRRYRQYHHQMQIIVSSFGMVAGRGAAKPYTALALQTISRHFRCLRDAIDGQLQVTRQSLGEQDATPAGHGALPRLRYVDQQLRQQKALQQFGVMRHSWRPQRGLPENSVSILRAWLFEHFLHPYPKDSEKIMLAQQTGLTRSQVANWFINARVRLWKPMVEDMYKEEFGELDSKSSPDHASKNANDKSLPSEDTGEMIQENVTPRAVESDHLGEFDDSKPNLVADVGMQGCTARLGFQNSGCGDNYIDCRMMKLQDDQIPNMDDHNLSADGNSITAAAAYNISELGNFSVGEQVSLALGLQRGEKDSLSLAGGMQVRGDYTAVSSADHDYHCMDSLNQQHGITNPEMLPDFVA